MTVREAFCKVLEAGADSRAEVLASLPAALRDDVASLLDAHFQAEMFLNPSTVPIASHSRMGAYRVVEKIGEGGMGVVYRAVRDDGEFQREVAIKVVGGRLFMPEAERRFIEERRILARLDHPDVVRMIDGDVAEGMRYLVMELVEGRPITQFCVEQSLSIPERVRLFQTVCAGAHHSHQNLVLHRDLKPQNILVTTAGQVKILDFGVARMLDDGKHVTGSQATVTPMSMAYASPEQLRGERATPASDIYSLGLVLYEDLTGRPVRPEGGTRQAFSSLESPIVPPSRSAPDAAVSPDLDAIVLKALAPEAAKRYASAAELSADLERFLEGRPVEARLPTRWYYASRFWARNKALGSALAALSLMVVAGLVAALVEGRRAAHQAEVVSRRFDESQRLIHSVIHDFQPRLRRISGTVEIREQLVAETLQYLEALSKDASDNPGVLRDLVEGYLELAAITGSAAQSSLGNVAKSGEIFTRAGALAESLRRVDADSPESLRILGRLYRAQAEREAQFGSLKGGQVYARQALNLAQRLAALDPGNEKTQDGLATALVTLADTLTDAPKERIPLYTNAADIWKKLENRRRDPTLVRPRNIALVYRDMATAWLNLEQFHSSLEAAQTAETYDRKLFESDPHSPAGQLDLAFDLGAIGAACNALRDLPHAIDAYRQSSELRERVVKANPGDARAADRLAYSLQKLAETEEHAGQLSAAREHFAKNVEIYSNLGKQGKLTFVSQFSFAMSLSALARLDRSRAGYRLACQEIRQMRTVLAKLDTKAAMLPFHRENLARMQREVGTCP